MIKKPTSEGLKKGAKRASRQTVAWVGVIVAGVIVAAVSPLVNQQLNLNGQSAKTGQITSAGPVGPAIADCGISQSPPVEMVSARWGPDRAGVPKTDPSTFVTINNILNTPGFGDERTFFGAKDARVTEVGQFCDGLRVQDGEFVLLRVYVDNSAADNLANGTTQNLILELSESGSGTLHAVSAVISASNSRPSQVFSTVDLAGTQPFHLVPQAQSGRIYNEADPEGRPLPDKLWQGGGDLLGYKTLDGRLPPGYQYTMLVTFTVRVTFD